MEVETTLAESIRTMDLNARYDAACKRLLSEKILLAWIMKSCVEEFQHCGLDDIAGTYIVGEPSVGETPVPPDESGRASGQQAQSRIRSVGQEDATLTEHTLLYDIRFVALAPSTGEPIRLVVNLEVQNEFSTGYPILKRAIYHCSRLISSQYGVEFTHSQFGEIRKVYSIWVCAAPPRAYRNTITRYRMTEENMVGVVHAEPRDYDLLTVILLGLGSEKDENYGGILKLLDVLLSGELKAEEKKRLLKRDFDLAMTTTMEQEVDHVCNLSEGVMKRGVEKGLQQGVERGRAESIRSLMESMGLTLEQAMDALKIPKEERGRYGELLKRQ